MTDAMIKCPGCDVELSEADSWAQVQHMQEHHPEIIRARLGDSDPTDLGRRYRLVLEFDDDHFEEHGGLMMTEVALQMAAAAMDSSQVRKAWVEPMEVQPDG